MNIAAQIDRLIELGYAGLLGLSDARLRDALLPLTAAAEPPPGEADLDRGYLPAVLVINTQRAPASRTLALAERRGLHAIERLHPRTSDQFKPIPSVPLPDGDAYVLLDVDRGNQTLNAVPTQAQAILSAAGRSPLTIAEGIAVLTLFPEFLQPNRCFMMLASRCGDKRVPALWLSEKRPKLGWCWEGNPHTWLGFASCGARCAGVAF